MLGSTTNVLLALLSALAIAPVGDEESGAGVKVSCEQTKPTSLTSALLYTLR